MAVVKVKAVVEGASAGAARALVLAFALAFVATFAPTLALAPPAVTTTQQPLCASTAPCESVALTVRKVQ